MKPANREEAKALRQAERWIEEVREVQGVAMGPKITDGRETGKRAVVVFVTQKSDRPTVMLPRAVGGVETDVIETGGPFVALSYTARERPARCGCSIGHFRITAGTLGILGRWKRGGQQVIVTNNHVGANSNDAVLGDMVLQPGPADNGQYTRDLIGRLVWFAPITMAFRSTSPFCRQLRRLARRFKVFGSEENLRDVALISFEAGTVSRAIHGTAGWPETWVDVEPGMAAAKSGRTTERTEGECRYVGASVQVSYGRAGMAKFRDQDAYSVPSAGGDSGSVITSPDGSIVYSLLFAGSPNITLGNPWRYIAEEVAL